MKITIEHKVERGFAQRLFSFYQLTFTDWLIMLSAVPILFYLEVDTKNYPINLGMFWILYLIACCGRIFDVLRHYKQYFKRVALATNGNIVEFLNIMNDGVEYGIRNVWSLSFKWDAVSMWRSTSEAIVLRFMGHTLSISTQFFTEEQKRELIEWLEINVKRKK